MQRALEALDAHRTARVVHSGRPGQGLLGAATKGLVRRPHTGVKRHFVVGPKFGKGTSILFLLLKGFKAKCMILKYFPSFEQIYVCIYTICAFCGGRVHPTAFYHRTASVVGVCWGFPKA